MDSKRDFVLGYMPLNEQDADDVIGLQPYAYELSWTQRQFIQAQNVEIKCLDDHGCCFSEECDDDEFCAVWNFRDSKKEDCDEEQFSFSDNICEEISDLETDCISVTVDEQDSNESE